MKNYHKLHKIIREYKGKNLFVHLEEDHGIADTRKFLGVSQAKDDWLWNLANRREQLIALACFDQIPNNAEELEDFSLYDIEKKYAGAGWSELCPHATCCENCGLIIEGGPEYQRTDEHDMGTYCSSECIRERIIYERKQWLQENPGGKLVDGCGNEVDIDAGLSPLFDHFGDL